MRWAENHGMPVHRYPGLKQGRVFAYRDELAAWLEPLKRGDPDQALGNGLETTSEHVGNHPEPKRGVASAEMVQDVDLSDQGSGESLYSPISALIPQTNPATPPLGPGESDTEGNRSLATLWPRRRLFAAVVGIVVFAVGVVAVLHPSVRSAATLRPAGLVQLTDDGRAKEGLQTDGTTLFVDEVTGRNRVLVSTPIEGGAVRPIPTQFVNAVLTDVSRDGKSLLVLSQEGIELAPQLWKLPARGGTPTRVGQIYCSSARWSPDGTQIAFTAGNHIYVTDSEGHEPHLVGSFDAKPGNLLWSPDGNRLRFVLVDETTGASAGWEIGSRGAKSFDGCVAKKLSLHSPCCADWTWTGDGRRFAYVVRQGREDTHFELSNQRLFLTGWLGVQRELSINLGRVHSLVSGKDGSRLYFLVSHDDRGELLKFNTSERVFQSYLPGLSARYLSFSHDGQWLSYVLTQDRSLWRSKADRTQALQIAGPPMEVELSSWSPDGRQIAFMGRTPGKPWRIYLVGRDGGSPREAAAGDDNQGAPSWSPDGKTITYGRINCDGDNSCGILVLDLETGHTRLLSASETLRTARWSPDGKYIAALQRDGRAAYLFNLSERRWFKLTDNVGGDDISWSKDSKALYLSCLVHEKPSIDKVKILDRSRSTVVDMTPFQKMPGQLERWFGLAPDESLVLLHLYTSSEVYALD